MRIVAAAMLVLTLACAGCATLERGTQDALYVTSAPPGAKATLSSGDSCVTPCSFDVHRRDTLTVSFEKAGFRPQSVTVTTRLSGSGVGDVMEDVASGGIGMMIDAGTGAALDHSPNPVSVTLQSISAPPRTAVSQHRPQS